MIIRRSVSSLSTAHNMPMKGNKMSNNVVWRRVKTKHAFCEHVAGRLLIGKGLEFVIYPDGRIVGTAEGKVFSGAWFWREGFFCRHAELEGEDLGSDCEVIEVSEGLMRYTRDRGEGTSAVVKIGHELSVST